MTRIETFEENQEQITIEETAEIDEAMEAERALDEQTIDTELSVPPKVISESWSVARLYKKYHNKKRKEIDFDIPQQRGIAWDIKRRSLYIHSVLMGLHVFQSAVIVNAVPDEDGKPVQKVYDGKQRCLSTLIKFLDNEYKLTGLRNEPPVLDDDGDPVNINGKFFKNLPDSLQQRLKDATITVAVAQNANEQMMGMIFRRINNGKTMSAFDISRSQSNSLDTMERIKLLSEHDLFKNLMKNINLEAKKQEEMVIKTWISMFEEEPCFTGKHVNDVMKTLDLSEEEEDKIRHAFDVLNESWESLTGDNSAIAKVAFNKTHLFIFIPYVGKFSDTEQFTNWLIEFFSDMPEDYAEVINAGHTTTPSSVKARYDIMAKNIEEFLSR